MGFSTQALTMLTDDQDNREPYSVRAHEASEQQKQMLIKWLNANISDPSTRSWYLAKLENECYFNWKTEAR